MIVGALELKGAEDALHLLAPASHQACLLSTVTTHSRALFIAGVGIETLRDRGSGQLQDLLSHGEFQRFQIKVFHCLTTEERLNLRNDVGSQ